MPRLDRCRNIAELRDAARRRLPRGIFEFLDRGAEDEIALSENVAAFRRVKLSPRAMVDVSKRSTAVTLLGKPSAMPLAIAPTGLAGLCWHDGELMLAKAAAKAGVPIAVSMGAISPIERIVAEAGGRVWFQMNVWTDRELSAEVVERARAVGCEALIVTVDSVVAGNREYNAHNGFRIPFRYSARAAADMLMHPRWLAGVIVRYLATTGVPRHENHPARHRTSILEEGGHGSRSDTVTWDDVRRLRDAWRGTFIVKGVLTPHDAEQAVAAGADAVVVSNHGGRHMDSAPATIEALPDIAAALRGRGTVFLDSGIRRGSDVVKALALGADAVMVGRATLYGVSVAGEAGAFHALALLRAEMERTMAYLGCDGVGEIDESVVAGPFRGCRKA
jgi:(S)-mandelate dehydrogenase